MRTLNLPKSGDRSQKEVFDDVSSVVIVGANGSGKSQLGAWIEENHPPQVETHRVAAQRSLVFQKRTPLVSTEQARSYLINGNDRAGDKIQDRWKGEPTSHPLDDFDHLLSFLFADESDRDRKFVQTCRGQCDAPAPEESIKETLERIWNDLMPQIEMRFEKNIVMAKSTSGEDYFGIGMSDGERVALYLIGQSLCAPENAIVIIDEPEIHLHRAVLVQLWDLVEAARRDCMFVYITHDLDFAASRTDAKKIWTQSFDGKNWRWEHVPEYEKFPRELILQIIGTQKPILFVEGTPGSDDSKLYRTIYHKHSIIPRGSCHDVIESTRAIRQETGFSKSVAFGLIDRDYRTEKELAALKRNGVYSTPVSEVENVFCMSEVVRAAAKHMEKNPNEVFENVKNRVLNEFEKDLDHQIAARVRKEIHFRLSSFDNKIASTLDELIGSMAEFVASVVPAEIYDRNAERLRKICSTKDYKAAIRDFNRKGLHKQIAPLLGMQPKDFPNWLAETLKKLHEEADNDTEPSDAGTPPSLLEEIREVFPDIPMSH